jgi:TPR repeat protein
MSFSLGSLLFRQTWCSKECGGGGYKRFRKAAEQNHACAQENLGIFYHDGKGVVKNEVEAVKWYRKAAEQDEAYAQSSLGY